MHHYGEKEVKVELFDYKGKGTFNIILTNYLTGAKITVSGPMKGLFETEEHMLDHMTAERLGREIAHTLKRVLTSEESLGSIGDIEAEI